MAGPGCSVLLPDNFDPVDALLLECWFDRAGIGMLARQWDDDDEVLDYDLLISDGRPLGLRERFDPRLVWAFLQRPELMREPDRFEALAEVTGWAPQAEIELAAVWDEPEDHRLIAGLAATLAERHGGVIDLAGAILPAPYAGSGGPLGGEPSYEEVHQYVSALPGRITTIRYQLTDTLPWYHHYGDATWLRAWLGHPDFHLVK